MSDETYTPYEAPANVGDWTDDRIGLGPLTVGNLGGLAVFGLACWKGTELLGVTGPNGSLAWWIQCGVVGAALVLGVLATARIGGASAVERLIWWIAYQVRRLWGSLRVAPHGPGIGRRRAGRALPIARGGRLVSAPYHPSQQEHTNGTDHP